LSPPSPDHDRPELLVETSALCAILLEEAEWQALTEKIIAADCRTTATNAFEAVLALAKQTAATPAQAYEDVLELTAKLSIEIVPFTPEMIPHAVAARERFGRGRKGLNMGDCLSYAAAKRLGLKLIYKGDDFAATDVNKD
jgi:ribonuclease VapC